MLGTTTRKAGKKSRGLRLAAAAWLLTMGVTMALPLIASAQFAEPLVGNVDPLPPPPGDGANPAPVIPGDRGNPLPPPSGMADPTHGNVFPVGTGRDRTTVYVYRRSQGGLSGGRGERMDMTIRPNQLSDEAIGRIEGILGINMRSGEQSIDVVATDAQLEQIQDVLAKYPKYAMENGRKKINEDAGKNTVGWQSIRKKESIYDFQGPLPTVRTFARYLVILGVVSATIWMSIAATSVLLGHRDGAAKVIGTASGLMLLLCAYTIWKIVQMNTFNANSDTPAVSENRPFQGDVSDAYVQNGPGTPGVPNNPNTSPPRSGVPLVPLGGADAGP